MVTKKTIKTGRLDHLGLIWFGSGSNPVDGDRPNQSGQVRSGQIKSGQNKSGLAGQIRSGQIQSGQVWLD